MTTKAASVCVAQALFEANKAQRVEGRELTAAAQNARRQQELRNNPKSARKLSPVYLAALEMGGALRRVS